MKEGAVVLPMFAAHQILTGMNRHVAVDRALLVPAIKMSHGLPSLPASKHKM